MLAGRKKAIGMLKNNTFLKQAGIFPPAGTCLVLATWFLKVHSTP